MDGLRVRGLATLIGVSRVPHGLARRYLDNTLKQTKPTLFSNSQFTISTPTLFDWSAGTVSTCYNFECLFTVVNKFRMTPADNGRTSRPHLWLVWPGICYLQCGNCGYNFLWRVMETKGPHVELGLSVCKNTEYSCILTTICTTKRFHELTLGQFLLLGTRKIT